MSAHFLYAAESPKYSARKYQTAYPIACKSILQVSFVKVSLQSLSRVNAPISLL